MFFFVLFFLNNIQGSQGVGKSGKGREICDLFKVGKMSGILTARRNSSFVSSSRLCLFRPVQSF